MAEVVAQLLVTYARHPAEAEDVLTAIDAVLGAGACERLIRGLPGRRRLVGSGGGRGSRQGESACIMSE